ncbi:site-2 protease family protein [Desulfosediminicola flagellatus]|uniref:site-2 protease family protein n=1 Tax=Desulfosediminicola flagellatus TaxID=2569541 RepID=UPI0010ADA122|nr:site-2 protease family protein [Desulfosediminicola flagellatus]
MITEQERKLRNLQIVAEHHIAAGGKGTAVAVEETPSAGSTIKKWGALGIPLIFLFGKLKWIAVIFKLTKLSTLATMFVAIWVYAQLWGAPFAIGFVLLIYIHEMGHAVVMNRLGIKAGAPIFIPFVGAIIAMKELPRNAYNESLIAAGGPILGTIGATVCLLVGWQMDSQFFYALASVGFMLNLFNMLPISPLDGGRMTGVISQKIKIVGLIVGGFIFYKMGSPILLIILIFGVISLFKKDVMPEDYYNVPLGQKRLIGVLYFFMIFFMTAGMWLADQPLKHLV